MQTITIKVRVFSREAKAHGMDSPYWQWLCEPKDIGPFAAVLGRGRSESEAIADFKFRASKESYAKHYNWSIEIVK